MFSIDIYLRLSIGLMLSGSSSSGVIVAKANASRFSLLDIIELLKLITVSVRLCMICAAEN